MEKLDHSYAANRNGNDKTTLEKFGKSFVKMCKPEKKKRKKKTPKCVITIRPGNFTTLEHLSQTNEKLCLNNNLYTHVHTCSTLNLETIQMSFIE